MVVDVPRLQMPDDDHSDGDSSIPPLVPSDSEQCSGPNPVPELPADDSGGVSEPRAKVPRATCCKQNCCRPFRNEAFLAEQLKGLFECLGGKTAEEKDRFIYNLIRTTGVRRQDLCREKHLPFPPPPPNGLTPLTTASGILGRLRGDKLKWGSERGKRVGLNGLDSDRRAVGGRVTIMISIYYYYWG